MIATKTDSATELAGRARRDRGVRVGQLAPGIHFTVAEFACHDGTPYPESWVDRWNLLVELCDAVRALWGDALSVVSGYRSPAYNANLVEADVAAGVHQVASGSYHMLGMAADLRPTAVGPLRIEALHAKVLDAYNGGRLPALGGLGIYPRSGWIHVDTFKAADGHLRRWSGT